jgi:hypothetical protein
MDQMTAMSAFLTTATRWRKRSFHVEQSEPQLPENGILDLGRQSLEVFPVIGGHDNRCLNPHLIGRAFRLPYHQPSLCRVLRLHQPGSPFVRLL